MNEDEYKPNIPLREEVAKDDVILLDQKRVSNMRDKTLVKAEEYYRYVLEALVGKQVWAILDSLAAVEEEIKSRKSPVGEQEFEQVKVQIFTELDRNYKNGHQRRAS